ncbi:MAG: murein transglycosylase A [Gluconacetobacter diazotrophicus]|nr:murein transglycosylase A [Gluconacetobacter diazotrophicus]
MRERGVTRAGIRRGVRIGAVAAVVAAVLAGCAAPSGPPELALRRVDPAAVPGWDADPLDGVLPRLLADCTRLARLPPDARLGGAAGTEAGGRAGLYGPACRAASVLRNNDRAALRGYLQTWFLFYEVSNGGDAEAQFSGYFEPEIAGSLSREPGYAVPVYARPPELGPPGSAPVPRWTRAQIDRGALAGRGLELLWLRDPVDLFFLQVQGSGRVRLPSGQIVRLGYDGRNGQPYVPLGRVLVGRGAIAPDAVSLQSIRNWLAAHPREAASVMEQNPNYVFFRSADALYPDQGPVGALGVPLAPLRSAAVDRSFLPLGAPLFVAATDPDGAALDRLMFAQDLGADVAGPTRADLFFGWGAGAEAAAGRMRGGGRLFVLLPRQPAGS